jgi:molybdopterin converting factor small subunit
VPFSQESGPLVFRLHSARIGFAMKIQVALYAGLSRYLPAGTQKREARIDTPDGATVLDVMRQLGMPDDLPSILLVNGKQATHETGMGEGDTLSVFPPLAGGGPPRSGPVSDLGR